MADKKVKVVGQIILEKDNNTVVYYDWETANAEVQKGWNVRINKSGKKLGKKVTASKETKTKK